MGAPRVGLARLLADLIELSAVIEPAQLEELDQAGRRTHGPDVWLGGLARSLIAAKRHQPILQLSTILESIAAFGGPPAGAPVSARVLEWKAWVWTKLLHLDAVERTAGRAARRAENSRILASLPADAESDPDVGPLARTFARQLAVDRSRQAGR